MNRASFSKSIALFATIVVTTSVGQMSFAGVEISSHQFKQEIQSHRDRVLSNSQIIQSQFHSQFFALMSLPAETRQELMKSYMSLHDVPKLMTKKQLAAYAYLGEKSIFEQLHEVYGVRLQERPQFIEDLNSIEALIKDKMLKANFTNIDPDLMSQVIAELKYIEWIADITDTLQMRGLELGEAFSRSSAEKYFKNRNDLRAAKIARWLGANRYNPGFIGHYCAGIFAK